MSVITLIGYLILGLFLHFIIAPIAFLSITTYKAIEGGLRKYLFAVVIGLDQLGGSILFGKMNWTISGWSFHLCRHKHSKLGCFLMRLIDRFFGYGHCAEAFEWDLKYDAHREL